MRRRGKASWVGELLLSAACIGLAAPAPAQGACAEAGKDGTVVRGKLETKGKAKSGPILLRSPVPTCLSGPDPEDKVAPSSVLHVFGASDAVHRQLAALVGKSVVITGRLRPAHTVHHKAPIIVEATQVGAAP